MDWDRFTAGFLSGFAFQVLHPLDLMRIRFQAVDHSSHSNVPRYSSYRDLWRKVKVNEGLRSLYKGVLFSIIPNASFGFFMMFNHFFRKKLQKFDFFSVHPNLAAFGAAAASAFSISAVFNPLYVVKTWKVIDQNRFDQRLSFWKVCREIRQRNGWLGFMRGYWMMVLTAVNGTITLGTIETVKQHYPEIYTRPWGVFLISGLSRVFSSTLLYPFSTIRTRISQNQTFEGLDGFKYRGVADCARKLYHDEGVAAFYQGIGANSVKAFLTSGILFFVYEGVLQHLRERQKGK